jgi:hypothetical protein
MEFYGPIGLKPNFKNEKIIPVVWIGNTDVSDDIVEEQWTWTRTTDDPASDIVWNATWNTTHVDNRRELLLADKSDMGSNWSRNNPAKFTCTAIYPASVINEISLTIPIG